jgi:succinate dehydrogenase / fumarate reductase iron-sulfur subunit
MTRFYDHYKKVKPFLEAADRLKVAKAVTPGQSEKLEKWANCILCGACYGACPVCYRDPAYLGPHALAWALRFVDDPRAAAETDERLSLVKGKDGVSACEWFYNCVRACPKEVAPAAAIRILKNRLAEQKLEMRIEAP